MRDDLTVREKALRRAMIEAKTSHMLDLANAYPDVGPGPSEITLKKAAEEEVDKLIDNMFTDLTTMVRAATDV